MIFGKSVSTTAYWRGVREIQQQLVAGLPEYPPPTFFIASNENGSICDIDSEGAAKLLYVNSHRIATPEEVAAWKKKQEETRAANAKVEYDRKQQYAMDPLLSAALASVLAGGKKQDTKENK